MTCPCWLSLNGGDPTLAVAQHRATMVACPWRSRNSGDLPWRSRKQERWLFFVVVVARHFFVERERLPTTKRLRL